MALIWADNFGWVNSAQLSRLYTISGTVSVSGTVATLSGTGAQLLAIPTQPVPSGATAILSFDFQITATPAAVQALCNVRLGATVHVTVAINTSRQIAVYRNGTGGTLLGTSTYVVPLNTRLHFSLRTVIDNAGSAVVRITDAGTTTITNNLTTVDTQEGGSATWDRFTVNGCNSLSTLIENLVAQDGTGTVNHDILGPDVEVRDFRPDGVGSNNEWQRVGSVFRHQNVDDPTANDDTDYNYSDSGGVIDTHEMAGLLNPSLTVYGVMIVMTARMTGTGVAKISPVVREGTTDTVGSEHAALTTTYTAYQATYSTPPAGGTWDVDRWNLAQLGYKRTT